MTLHAYGRPIALDAVNAAMAAKGLDMERNGLSAHDLITFAEENGLGATGVVLDVPRISCLKPGDILHFDMRYFVVFDRVDGKTVQILDPAEGSRAIDEAEFSARFTGVALLFAASPDAMRRRKRALGL